MNKKLYVLIFCLLVIFTVFAGCTDVGYLYSSQAYSLEIKADAPVENATFIIPLPVLNGTPVIGNVILEPEDLEYENVTVEFTKNPPGLDLTGADDLGYEPCFVVLHADMLVPEEGEYPGYPSTVYRITKGSWKGITDPNELANTLNPVGNISLVIPKYNFRWPEPEIKKIYKTNIIYTESSVSHMIPLFADYYTTSSTELSIYMSFRSVNGWNEGYDTERGNCIYEDFSKQFIGPQNNWYMAGCTLKRTYNYFPNLESPEWQKLIVNSSKE